MLMFVLIFAYHQNFSHCNIFLYVIYLSIYIYIYIYIYRLLVFYFGIIHLNQLNVVQCVLQLPCQLPKEIVWKVDHKSKAHLTLFPGKEVGSIVFAPYILFSMKMLNIQTQVCIFMHTIYTIYLYSVLES
jgi:hypothetical protein